MYGSVSICESFEDAQLLQLPFRGVCRERKSGQPVSVGPRKSGLKGDVVLVC